MLCGDEEMRDLGVMLCLEMFKREKYKDRDYDWDDPCWNERWYKRRNIPNILAYELSIIAYQKGLEYGKEYARGQAEVLRQKIRDTKGY